MPNTGMDYMTFPKILAFTKAIIGFEYRDLTRNPPQMAKRTQKRKWQRGIRKELESTWDSLWPQLQGITEEKYERMMKFKQRMEDK